MLPVTAQVPVAGVYSSALASGPAGPSPPATKTWPLASSVAVAEYRAVCMLPVSVHFPVAGVYSSAVASATQL